MGKAASMMTFFICPRDWANIAAPAEPAIPIPHEDPIRPPASAIPPPRLAKDIASTNIFYTQLRLASLTGTSVRFLSRNGLYSLPPPS